MSPMFFLFDKRRKKVTCNKNKNFFSFIFIFLIYVDGFCNFILIVFTVSWRPKYLQFLLYTSHRLQQDAEFECKIQQRQVTGLHKSNATDRWSKLGRSVTGTWRWITSSVTSWCSWHPAKGTFTRWVNFFVIFFSSFFFRRLILVFIYFSILSTHFIICSSSFAFNYSSKSIHQEELFLILLM